MSKNRPMNRPQQFPRPPQMQKVERPENENIPTVVVEQQSQISEEEPVDEKQVADLGDLLPDLPKVPEYFDVAKPADPVIMSNPMQAMIAEEDSKFVAAVDRALAAANDEEFQASTLAVLREELRFIRDHNSVNVVMFRDFSGRDVYSRRRLEELIHHELVKTEWLAYRGGIGGEGRYSLTDVGVAELNRLMEIAQ